MCGVEPGSAARVTEVAATVSGVKRSTVRTWRMRPWPDDPTVAHLVFLDHADVPGHDEIAAAVADARRRRARAVRTSALFPRAAEIVLDHGFETIDRLALLSRPVSEALDPSHRGPTRPMLPWHLSVAASIDREAFGPDWGNDASALLDIRRATPRHRARIVRDGRTVAGFAITGAAGEQGYLQRLAVAPVHHRRGFARVLVADALHWMVTQRLSTALVNTGVDNVPALALYEGFGFRRLDHELTIAELRLDQAPMAAGWSDRSEPSR